MIRFLASRILPPSAAVLSKVPGIEGLAAVKDLLVQNTILYSVFVEEKNSLYY